MNRIERMRELTEAKYEGSKPKPSIKKENILPPSTSKPKTKKKRKK